MGPPKGAIRLRADSSGERMNVEEAHDATTRSEAVATLTGRLPPLLAKHEGRQWVVERVEGYWTYTNSGAGKIPCGIVGYWLHPNRAVQGSRCSIQKHAGILCESCAVIPDSPESGQSGDYCSCWEYSGEQSSF